MSVDTNWKDDLNTKTYDKGPLYVFRLDETDRSVRPVDCAYSWEEDQPYRKGRSLILHPPFTRIAWGLGFWSEPVDTWDEQERRMGIRSIGPLVEENDVWLEIE